MLKRLNKIKSGPATGVPLDFVVSTGDNVDNNQLNETRWFIDLLDGERVNPNSGGPTYDGYTREQFGEALPDADLERAQEPFDAVGTRSPWYAVLGNHDGLVQGNAPANPGFEQITTGGIKAFAPIEAFEDCPDGTDTGGVTLVVLRALADFGRQVPEDDDRHFLSLLPHHGRAQLRVGRGSGRPHQAFPQRRGVG